MPVHMMQIKNYEKKLNSQYFQVSMIDWSWRLKDSLEKLEF